MGKHKVVLVLPPEHPMPAVELYRVGIVTKEPREFELDDDVLASVKQRGLVLDVKGKNKSNKYAENTGDV